VVLEPHLRPDRDDLMPGLRIDLSTSFLIRSGSRRAANTFWVSSHSFAIAGFDFPSFAQSSLTSSDHSEFTLAVPCVRARSGRSMASARAWTVS
jgi:hypothetical protein